MDQEQLNTLVKGLNVQITLMREINKELVEIRKSVNQIAIILGICFDIGFFGFVLGSCGWF